VPLPQSLSPSSIIDVETPRAAIRKVGEQPDLARNVTLLPMDHTRTS
jgi:hypothetical protein